MTRGVLGGGTLLLYATFAYGVGPQVLGGLATTSSIIGIPITLSGARLRCCLDSRSSRSVSCFSLQASSAGWQWSLTSFILGLFWIHAGHSVTSGSMQVVGSDMAPAAARGRFFGFWRLVGEIGGMVSPALFALVADHITYSAAFALFALCSFVTAALLNFSVKEIAGRRSA
jgi:MFS-type transporter involved in bile tolerance (Atg22 family)